MMIYKFALALAGLLLSPGLSWAASCSGTTRSTTWAAPATLEPLRDAPNGTVLFSTGWMDSGSASANCTGPGNPSLDIGYASAPSNSTQYPSVYETSVPGIGIKVGYHNTYNTTPSGIDASNLMKWPRVTNSIPATNYTPAQRFWVQLIKIGPISSGTLSVPPIRHYYHNLLTNQLTFTPVQVNVRNRGCQVTTNPVNVHLPKVNQKAFTGIGSTAGAKPFSIDLACDANVKVSYFIDGYLASIFEPNVLAIDSGPGQATGVGIKLFKGDASSTTVQTLGEKIFQTTTSTSQNLSIHLTARYYQFETDVTPGQVSSSATVTLFYE